MRDEPDLIWGRNKRINSSVTNCNSVCSISMTVSQYHLNTVYSFRRNFHIYVVLSTSSKTLQTAIMTMPFTLSILSRLLLHSLWWHHAYGDTAEHSDQNCVHPLESYTFGGENAKNAAARLMFNTKPVVLPCKSESMGSKWLRFRVNKKDSIDDGTDEIELFTATGIMCSDGASFDDSTLQRAKSICKR